MKKLIINIVKRLGSTSILTSILVLTLISTSYAQKSKNNSYIVSVGGGTIDSALWKKTISLVNQKEVNLLIIPYASKLKEVPATVDRVTKIFQEYGIKSINILDVNEPQKAEILLNKCNLIWIPGGSQVLLRKTLDEVGLTQKILERYRKGNIVIGGTSAGASIVTDVMMSGGGNDKITKLPVPKLNTGFKLWTDVIIDQHFTQRKRLNRLKIAMLDHKNLLGIGLDEGTAVINDGTNKIYVVGKGTVTFIKVKSDNSYDMSVLKNGEIFTK